MEIYCPICGETWALECLHHEVVARYGEPLEGCTYDARLGDVRRDFQRRGCEALSNEAAPRHRARGATGTVPT